MNPAVNLAIDLTITAIIAMMKAQGLTEQEAKAKLLEKIAQIEQLKDLPT